MTLACSEEEQGSRTDSLKAEAEALLGESSSIAGPIGYELLGRGNTFYSLHFDEDCIEGEQLGWVEAEGAVLRGEKSAFFELNYDAQQYITATTDEGYCLYMGEDLNINLVDVVEDAEGRELEGNPNTLTWSITISDPSPYFECLSSSVRNPSLTLSSNQPLAAPGVLSLFDNGCQALDDGMPGPYDREEAATDMPQAPARPPAAPSAGEVSELMREMDRALADRDLEAALDLTQCYNLFILDPKAPPEDEEWQPELMEDAVGACIPSDLLDTGPAFADSGDGWRVPWLEFTIDSASQIGAITVEKGEESRSFYHVELAGTATDDDGENRAITVQHVDGEWKLVGLIENGIKGITPVRYVNDLHSTVNIPMKPPSVQGYWEWDVPHWFVFWDRLHGAYVDYQGCPMRKGGGSDCTKKAMKAFEEDPRHRRR